jgi:hypothetical protein
VGKLSFKLIGALLFIAIAAMFLSSLFAIPFAVPFLGLLAASFVAIPQGSLMETLTAPLMETLNEMKAALVADMENKASDIVIQKLTEVNTAINELKAIKPGATADEVKAIKDDLDAQMRAIGILSAKVKGQKHVEQVEVKSFNQILAETIAENADAIKGFKPGSDEKRFEMKAVGDMSVAANFQAATALAMTQDVRNNIIIEKPYNRVWLADLLPSGVSGGSQVLYPKENGGEGGAAVWTDKTADKAQMDFDITGYNAYFKWIAGIVIIEREMLDDIPFLQSYLQNKMLISLKIAENDFILNGTSDTNPVQGLLDVATAYDGTYTKAIERIMDAQWGQLVESTFDFYNPTNTILTPRDAVKVGLNTATGSGEYDLPNGSVGYANGNLQIGGIDVTRTTQVGTGNFLTFDRNALMYITRMQPELRMFEDAALAKKNKIMFRVEKRATLAVFNNAAVIKGTLAPVV